MIYSMSKLSTRHLYINMSLNAIMVFFIVTLAFFVPFLQVESANEVGTTYLQSFLHKSGSNRVWFFKYRNHDEAACRSQFQNLTTDIEYEMCLNAPNLFFGGLIVRKNL